MDLLKGTTKCGNTEYFNPGVSRSDKLFTLMTILTIHREVLGKGGLIFDLCDGPKVGASPASVEAFPSSITRFEAKGRIQNSH